ncbi:MAG: hypothetical protein HY289_08460 [Planctomycetes bacterium]|nr:hypothetical protein [Planctomycetota bacterium]
MLRLRLAFFAAASGVLFTLSGCCAFCEDGRLFPRLLPNHRALHSPRHGDCECMHQGHPAMMEGVVQGPVLTPPNFPGQPTMIPSITNIPANQPPQVFKVPQAQTTPYTP